MQTEAKKKFPIRELSELTEVNTVTIRAWERRYGLLKPERTEKGHRLYDEDDVKSVKAILAFMAKGVPVGKVKALLDQDITVLPEKSDTDWHLLIGQLETILLKGSVPAIRNFLGQLFLTYPVNLCRKEVIEPIMARLEVKGEALAEAALLQSAIVDYSLNRLQSKTKQKAGKQLILICAERTPMWKLAVSAIELTDAGFVITFINQPCSIMVWLGLIEKYPGTDCIVFQEGVWREHERQQVLKIVVSHGNLLFCGTAATVAKIEDSKCIYSPEKILEYLTKNKSSER